jgi:hypothetical protein
VEQRQENGAGTAIAKRDQLGNAELTRTGETAAVAQAHQGAEMVRARFTLAIARPRQMAVVRERALDECQRPRFAQVARYRVPRGGATIEGWSIRAAEALGRIFGNIDVSVRVIADDTSKRILQVTAIDLESNFTTSAEVTVAKTIERKQLRNGQTAIATRIGGDGNTLFIIEASDDDLLVKQNALISKARRNCILQLIPGDLLDEMLEVVKETQRQGDKAEDPTEARKKLADAFLGIGIKAPLLAEYVQARWSKRIDLLSPDEIGELREVFVALRDKETTWKEVMAGVVPDAEIADEKKTSASAPPKTTADLKAREKAKSKTAAVGEDGGPEPPISGDREPGSDG